MAAVLGSHQAISMRSTTDKEFSAIELDQLFDQFTETGTLLQHFSTDASSADLSSSDDLAHLFDLPSSNGSDPFDDQPLPDWDAPSDDAWHKALRLSTEQNAASPTINDVSAATQYPLGLKSSFSDPELREFDELLDFHNGESKAASQPPTPQAQVTRLAKKAKSTPDLSNRHGTNRIIKKPSVPSIPGKMLRSSHHRINYQDAWTRKLEGASHAFNLQTPVNSLPNQHAIDKFDHVGHTNGYFSADSQPYTIAVSPMPGNTVSAAELHHTHYQLTPLSSPAVDINSQNEDHSLFTYSHENLSNAYITQPISNGAAISALHTPPPSNRLPIRSWGNNSSTSVDFAGLEGDDRLSAGASHGWWEGAEAIPISQPPTPTTYHAPQARSSHHHLGFDMSSTVGLGIIDSSAFPGQAYSSTFDASSTVVPAPATPFELGSYAPMCPATPGIPIGTGPARPPSRSSSISPQPQFTRRRHSQQAHHAQVQNPAHAARSHRRKSSNSSTQSTSQRHSSGSTNGGGGFVNFTPSDSRKILTGVAPSGSSKTKARREKEAAEKRRKLSQAAVRAVVEAGGDLGRLEKEGLLALES